MTKMDHWSEKAYAMDENNRVTGLWLDAFPVILNPEISRLTNLSTLILRKGFLKDIDLIYKLEKLTTLKIESCYKIDFFSLKELTNLNSLDLSSNKVNDISFVVELPILGYISLYGVETLEEPPENILDQGIRAIRNYFDQQKEQGTERLYEAKILIVGEPG